jgi:hypothetical protein
MDEQKKDSIDWKNIQINWTELLKVSAICGIISLLMLCYFQARLIAQYDKMFNVASQYTSIIMMETYKTLSAQDKASIFDPVLAEVREAKDEDMNRHKR